ncbi:MAG: hypothetical protein ACRC4W_04695, partial [Treponemataceae bacterium]
MNYEDFKNKIEAVGEKIGFLNKGAYKLLSEMIADDEIIIKATSCTQDKAFGAFVLTKENIYVGLKEWFLPKRITIPIAKVGAIYLGFISLSITEGTFIHEFDSVLNSKYFAVAIKEQQAKLSKNIQPSKT